jgi:hypothetical protein
MAPKTKSLQEPLRPDGKLEQRCDCCNKPFRRRHGSGGSPQRFCSTECRMAFHTEDQRSRRKAAYIARTTLPATSQPISNETPMREPAAPAQHPGETGVLDIANCQRTEFVVALNDREAAGTRVETWSPEVQAFMHQHVAHWIDENKDARNVHARTVAAPKYDGIQSCVTILHHRRTDFKARQRTERRAAYIASTRLPATGLPLNETPLQEPAAAALHAWETGVLDIAHCDRVEFVLALNEGETAGTGIETWPTEVRASIEHGVSRWVEENKSERTVRAMTVATPKHHGVQHCVVILHHIRKASQPVVLPATQDKLISEVANNA